MTKDQAEALRDRRAQEHPEYDWVVRVRAGDDWAVLRLPRGSAIDRSSVEAQKGEPIEIADDPRVASERNIPPLGPGF